MAVGSRSFAAVAAASSRVGSSLRPTTLSNRTSPAGPPSSAYSSVSTLQSFDGPSTSTNKEEAASSPLASSSSSTLRQPLHRRPFSTSAPGDSSASRRIARAAGTGTARQRPPSPTLSSSSGSASRRTFSTSAPARATPKDPYSTLGVKRDAKPKEIKAAYYDLAKKYHPDTNKDPKAKERFVEIQSAYDILSDEKKKAAFDQFGTTDGQPGFNPFGGGGSPFAGGGGGFGGFAGFGGAGPGGPGGGTDPFSAFEHIFGRFAGAGGGRGGGNPFGGGGAGFAGEMRGDDLETTVNISFEEACRGTTRTIQTNPIENCSPCGGSGMRKGAKKRSCSRCGGTGTQTFVIQGGFQMASRCPACSGTGATVDPSDACGTCGGGGRTRGRRTVEVKIPPGVDNGVKIRLDGQGDAPQPATQFETASGPPGNLYVRVNVQPSKIWRRQGSNLYYEAKVPFYTAVLGGKVRVPTLDGDVDVRVPSGTQVGEEMLLRGRGVPSVSRRGEKGDLLVAFDVTIPRFLTKSQRELLQRFVDDVEGRTPPPPPPPPPNPTPAPSSSSQQPSGSPDAPKQSAPDASKSSDTSPKPDSESEPKKPEPVSSSQAQARQTDPTASWGNQRRGPVNEPPHASKDNDDGKATSKPDEEQSRKQRAAAEGDSSQGDGEGEGGPRFRWEQFRRPAPDDPDPSSFEEKRQTGALVGLAFLGGIMILAGIGFSGAADIGGRSAAPYGYATNPADGTRRPLSIDEALDREVQRRRALQQQQQQQGVEGGAPGLANPTYGSPPMSLRSSSPAGEFAPEQTDGDRYGSEASWPPYPRAAQPMMGGDDAAESRWSSLRSDGSTPAPRSSF
ncbi:mdj1 protein precursor [Tilletia horrida]|uniref:DnaJ homolog 1, mitochondrial n=1 Tax=Tilletia horrida TaxID=155126 RepID=A0AAN6GLB2_9BASI|nr:mdj1 protein precursor [Tilletia horrida]KAK0561884.1 mdj1 protein precursor [Tilletia horrida]